MSDAVGWGRARVDLSKVFYIHNNTDVRAESMSMSISGKLNLILYIRKIQP